MSLSVCLSICLQRSGIVLKGETAKIAYEIPTVLPRYAWRQIQVRYKNFAIFQK